MTDQYQQYKDALEKAFIRVTEHPRPEGYVTLETQLEAFECHAESILDGIIDSLQDPFIRPTIIKMARERLAENFVQYGDTMFHRHDDELAGEVFEEIADAINWTLPIRHAQCLQCREIEDCYTR